MTNSSSEADKPINVAVDAMGGDNAPEEVVLGAVESAKEGTNIFLVGSPEQIQPLLQNLDISGLPLQFVPSEGTIGETEQPILALRKKPKASVNVAASLVQKGTADAFVSMGPTGATMISAIHLLGMIEGIERPILGGPVIDLAPETTLFDLGVNVDSKPRLFLEFAAIGVAFCREYLGLSNPTIALMNVGEEEAKGNRQVKEVFPLLSSSGYNFIGNIEAHEYFSGKANIVLADGFVGNILLKFSEGMGYAMADYLHDQLTEKLPANQLDQLKENVISKLDLLNTYGTPLWGIDGVSIVGHGRGKAKQVHAAIQTAAMVVKRDLISGIKQELTHVRESTQ